jgi:putative peptide zinc metalloprotease protein
VTPPLDTTSSSTITPLASGTGDGGPAIGSPSLEPGRVDATPHPPVPAPAAGVELFGETPGSGYREPPSLARRSDGQTIQLTPLLYEVLRAIDGRRTYHEIAALVSERIGRTASAADVLFLAEAKLRPLGLLRNPDGSEPELQRANPLLALRCRFVISKPELTRRITSPFAALFRPTLVLLFFAAFLWTSWWTFFEQGMASSIHQAFYEPHLLLLVFALTLVSAGFHEFGHAAACRYGGATPGAMGFGLYLIWPAFYTDVTDSYRLGRAGRLRVDLGGLYFNMIFAVATFAAWAWLRADALLLLIVAQVLQMSRQLAPLVRFDGYHILSDLIGVPDLFAHMKPTLLGLLPSRWRSGQHQALEPWARVAITLWVLIVLPLLLVMLATIVMILPRLAATAWDSLGVQWEVLGRNWADGAWADVGIRVLSIISLGLPVLTVTYLIARVTRRGAAWLWRASEGSAMQRAAAGFGAVAVLGAVAFAWWPQGQFTPIDRNEEGTVQELFSFVGLLAPELVRTETDPAQAVPAAGDEIPATPPLPAGSAAGPPRLALVAVPSSQPRPSAAPAHAPLPEPIPNDDAAVIIDLPAGEPPDGAAEDWPFPWRPPPPTSEGDNRALVVNTVDGSTVYDLALAFVWVTDGGPVEHRNDALAYASCTDCKSVAVAFQVVLIIGQADEIIPVNVSEAGNFECEACTTHALALQLVATLREIPSEEVLSELGRVWAELEQLEEHAESLTFEQVYTWLKYVEAQIMTILEDSGAILYGNAASVAADVDGPEPSDADAGDEALGDAPPPDGSAADEQDTGGTGDRSPAEPTSESATRDSTAPGRQSTDDQTTDRQSTDSQSTDSQSADQPTDAPSPAPTSSPAEDAPEGTPETETAPETDLATDPEGDGEPTAGTETELDPSGEG